MEMPKLRKADAPSPARCQGTLPWHEIKWKSCNRTVRRLQARIVKALKKGKFRLARNLQRLLVHCLAAKRLAVRRVTETKGKRSAGVDGEKWTKDKQKSEAVKTLAHKGYKSLPLRRVRIPKAKGGSRPLGIPTMKDRAMQALHSIALEPIAETLADKASYGFRRERSCHDAIKRCFLLMSKKRSPQWVLDADIKGCFDNLSHEWLLENIPVDKSILKKWLKAGFIENGRRHRTLAGTPQGGVISPTLANMALDGLQQELKDNFPKKLRYKVNLCRYADDLVITGVSKEILEQKVKPVLEEFLTKRGLQLSPTKTRIVHISEGYDFLGKTFRKFGDTLLVTPSKAAIRNFQVKITQVIRSMYGHSAYELLSRLNSIIIGWRSYHRYANSSTTFSKLDFWITAQLIRWARRRHANKRYAWIKEKYFEAKGDRNTLFYAQHPEKGFKFHLALLCNAPIKTYPLIKGDANPFDPDDEFYFESRYMLKASHLVHWQRQALYKTQQGICPMCQQELLLNERWDIHHHIFRSLGGDDTLANLRLLHSNCHCQLHNQHKLGAGCSKEKAMP